MTETSNPLDLAAIMAAHEGHYPTPHGEMCRRCAEDDGFDLGQSWPCVPYRLAELAQEQAATIARVEALAGSLTWKRPAVCPCKFVEDCCGSESSCDAMQPTVAVVGEGTIRAALAGEQ
jgi:hypothetical protein